MNKIYILVMCLLSLHSKSGDAAELSEKARSILDIYSDGVSQIDDAAVTTKLFEGQTVEIVDLATVDISSFLKNEFGSNIVEGSNSIGGKAVRFWYRKESFTESGVYVIEFVVSNSAERAAELISAAKRKHFRTQKIATKFNWYRDGTCIVITFGRVGLWKG